MMIVAAVIFWSCLALVGYAYAGYPLLIAALARLLGRPVRRQPGAVRSVSVVIAARNEAAHIGRRIQEFETLLAAAGVDGEILIISDGSTDDTVAIARAAGAPVRVIELVENRGKAAAVSEACAVARGEVLVLADARQRWDANALSLLLENFADPRVGAVSGELMLESDPGVLAGVGLYWRYEKWIRKQESLFDSTVGLTGAICAVRRELFRPIPAWTILDDVYWPLAVAMQGYRVVFDARALAFDRLPERTADEFRRKVRTLSGNFQLIQRLPAALLPWRSPVWWQLVSHKLLRLAVPWALLIMLGFSLFLEGPVYGTLLVLQVLGYLVGLMGLWKPIGERSRLAAAGASFLVLNAAACLAFWVWVTGRTARSWTKTRYADTAQSPVEPKVPVS